MASYLHDLKVKKVSLVSRGANRKQFFLAKAADSSADAASFAANNNSNNSGGYTTMRTEIRTKMAEILKGERNIDKVVSLLKDDTTLKATADELIEVGDLLKITLPPAVDADALAKAQSDAKKAEEEKKTLEGRLFKIEEDRHRDEVKKFVSEECSHLSMPEDEAVTEIIKAEKVDKSTAEALKRSFKSTSDALRTSTTFREVGRDGESFDPLCGNLVAEVTRKSEELKKGDSKLKKSDSIADAIRSVGSARFEQYRRDFNRRARAS